MSSSSAEVIRPLRRVEYEQLVYAGAFRHERVELINGVILQMSPIGSPHRWAVDVLNELFVLAIRRRAWVSVQSSFAAGEYSQPEPDLALVPRDTPRNERACQAYLIVEVSDSSLAYDRGKKARLYATSTVPEYWVVNIIEQVIEVYTQPKDGAYAQVERYQPGQSIRVGAFPDIEIAVSDVFG